ncbi:MAG: hypothetical protein ISR21_00270 [Candidatus Poseidoniaceae archaeon]|nr:hypothetical protein [Candidatus Poseidoniaceae archaeon]
MPKHTEMVLGMVMDEWLEVIEQDHEAAVNRLNQSLNLKGDALLDPNVPPHTYVGDIDSVPPVNVFFFWALTRNAILMKTSRE